MRTLSPKSTQQYAISAAESATSSMVWLDRSGQRSSLIPGTCSTVGFWCFLKIRRSTMSSTPKPTRGSTPVMQTKGYSPKAGLKRGSSFGDVNEPLGPPAMPALPAESLKRQKPHDKQMSGFIWSAKRQASIGGDSAEDMSDDSTAAAAVTQPQRAPRSASTASLQSLAAVDVSAATGQANDVKKEQRLARNREAARLRRLRSRARLEMLTAKVRDLESAVAAAERFTWGDGQPAELAQICGEAVLRTPLQSVFLPVERAAVQRTTSIVQRTVHGQARRSTRAISARCKLLLRQRFTRCEAAMKQLGKRTLKTKRSLQLQMRRSIQCQVCILLKRLLARGLWVSLRGRCVGLAWPHKRSLDMFTFC